MIENDIQKLTAAIEQLTVTAEALLETLRHKPAAVDVHKIAEGLNVLAKSTAIASDGTVIEPSAAEEPAPAPKPKKAKAPKVEEPAPVKAEEPAPAAPVAREYTLADLRDAAQRALDNGKLDDVVNLNKHYGVKRISEVPPELYGEIITKLEALVNG